MDFLKGGLWIIGNYPNLLGITPADRRPKSEEYNIDLGDPFGEKILYIKTPMRKEDFDMTFSGDIEGKDIKEEKNMSIYMCDMLSRSILNDLEREYQSRANKSECTKWIEGLPAVKKVETYNQRVVKVTFIDDTFTKSVCSENDHFDIDVGITICLLKRVMGSNGDDATRNYNKLMNQVHAVMEKNEKERLARTEEERTLKAKRRKIELKRAAKKLKAKEEQIDIQKQAIIRALNERGDDLK